MKSIVKNSPYRWVPSLYFFEGVPYVVINMISGVMFKKLGMGNDVIAFWTSILALPWVLKALWAPLLDVTLTKRRWTLLTQFVLAAGFTAGGLLLNFGAAQMVLVWLFLLLGFVSATHDAAADGLYIIALPDNLQALYSGIRGTCYRLAMIAGQGGLVVLAGTLEKHKMPVAQAWSVTLGAAGLTLLALWIYHITSLPCDKHAVKTVIDSEGKTSFGDAFVSFFRKEHIGKILAFILLYRLGEGQLGKISPLFLLDPLSAGGVGLTTQQHGIIYGSIGVAALLAGGIVGGAAISRRGFGFWIWPMALALNVPDVLYVVLAYYPDLGYTATAAMVAVEQFGYGFGFSLYMLFMVAVADSSGKYRTSHFAIMTGFMALGMMLPGMAAGYLQQKLGYGVFFCWVLLCTVPGFYVAHLAGKVVPAGFGCRK